MTNSMSYLKKLIRKGSRANSFTRRKPGSASDLDNDNSRCRPRDRQGCKARQTQMTDVAYGCERKNFVISKKDYEAFGFKIKTYEKNTTDSGQDMLTCVTSVVEKGPAESAGLRTGDLIISINSICVEDFVHQHIVDLIQSSSSHLKLEIVRGTTVKRRELQNQLYHLQGQLREKREELQQLISQEERLRGGGQSIRRSQSFLALEILPIPSQLHGPLPAKVH